MAVYRCVAALLLLIQVIAGRVLDPKIVGGEDATIEEFPYQVSIRVGGHHICGGSILSREIILTAAHCAQLSPRLYTVHAGSNDLQANTLPHAVTAIIVHENFVQPSSSNDIALLRISPPITYSSTQKPVGLPQQGQVTPAGFMAVATGWGHTEEGGQSPRILQKVSLPIVRTDVCRRLYDMLLPEHQICAGYLETGGKDACQGDSGGPLVVAGLQVGIVSWGYGCGQPKYPGVYTEVAAYRTWINRQLGL